MGSEVDNLENICTWMDQNFGVEQGRIIRQKDQFWSRKLNTALLNSVERSNLEQVNKWLRFGASVHAKWKDNGDAAVLLAASLEDDSILRKLLEMGALPKTQNKKGHEPIHVAVWRENSAAVSALCESDQTVVNSIIREESRETNDEQAFEAINKQPEDIISEDFEDGMTPLHIASSRNVLLIIQLLISKGAQVASYSTKTGSTPLDVAGIYATGPHGTEEAFMSVCSLFLNNKLQMPRVDEWISDGRCKVVQKYSTALHMAVEFEYLSAIEKLLDKGACHGVRNMWGETPIHWTVQNELMKPLLAILKWNKNHQTLKIDMRNHLGFTALQLASFLGRTDYVAVLLQGGADASLTTLMKRDFFTGGHWNWKWELEWFLNSINECDTQTSSGVIEIDKDEKEPKQQDLLTLTACGCAVMGNNLECVKILSMDRDLQKFTLTDRMNLVHLATWCNAPKIFEFLLDEYKELIMLNDKVDQVSDEGSGLNSFGMTPKDLASIHVVNMTETIKLLLEEGKCDVKLPAVSGTFGNNAPLHFVTIKGIWEDIERIYNYDKKTLKRKYEQRKSIYKHPDALRQFLLRGADLSSISKDERRKFTLVESIESHVDKCVDFLEEVLDAHIDTEHFNDDQSYVVLKYQILAPGCKREPQMRVLDALVTRKKVEDQQRLLLHPLTETFLYLKWQKLKIVYNVYVCLQLLMTVLITALGCTRYVNMFEQHTQDILATVFRCLLGFVTTFMLVMNPNVDKKLLKIEWLLKFQKLAWWTLVVVSFVLVFTNENQNWGRGVASLAILLSWIELLYLLARYPWSTRLPLGNHYVMFLTVAANFAQVAASLSLLFVAFSLAFLVLLSDDGDSIEDPNPFKSPIRSFLKTVTMMNNFDDKYFFSATRSPHIIGDAGSILLCTIFLGFFFLMGIALVNFITGIAIDDIAELKRQGKAHQIFDQARTLSYLEKIMNTALLKKTNINIQAPPKLVVWLKKCLHRNEEIPKELALIVYERVKIIKNNENAKQEKEKKKKEKEEQRAKKRETNNEIMNTVKEIKETISNLDLTTTRTYSSLNMPI